MKKIAIVGSRTYTNYEELKSFVFSCIPLSEIELVISGAAKNGADSLVVRFAKEFNLPLKEFPADWDTYGKRAGFIRNVDIVEASDMVICFWDGYSKGTKHDIDIATEKGKELHICKFQKQIELSVKKVAIPIHKDNERLLKTIQKLRKGLK
jgi:hypothetical protein